MSKVMAIDPSEETLRLTERASTGDRNAFAVLWKQNLPAIHAILRGMVPAQEADDLMHDVAVSALDSIRSLRSPHSFTAWLSTIARNTGRKAQAQSKRRYLPLVEIDDNRTPASAAVADEILDQIRDLPECYRAPLVLRLVLRMTGREIAHETGMTEGSVRVNLHRGMRMLRARLKRWL